MSTEYIPIKTEFASKGFEYKQILRDGDLAIYEQKSKNPKRTNIDYEVIRIRRHNGYKIADQSFPPSEMYPSNSQWGTFGWTCKTLEAAHRKIEWIKKHFLGQTEAEITDVAEALEAHADNADTSEIESEPVEQKTPELAEPRKPGRPRIHPKPDPNEPKRKPGRPKLVDKQQLNLFESEKDSK